MRSGNGKYTYANGDVYDGEWVSGVKEGNGAYTYKQTGLKVRLGGWVMSMACVHQWICGSTKARGQKGSSLAKAALHTRAWRTLEGLPTTR